MKNNLRFIHITSKNFTEHASLLEEAESIYPESIRLDIEEYEVIIKSPNSIGLIAYHDDSYVGNIVGCQPDLEDIAYVHESHHITRKKTIYVNNIIVLSEHQGKGYGKDLMLEFMEEAKMKGCTHLMGHFRKNGSYAIVKKFHPLQERIFENWEDTGEEFIFCLVSLSAPDEQLKHPQKE
jgi:GNAT superfamily N-acetyltransferase